MPSYEELVQTARQIRLDTDVPRWTEEEEAILSRFFSNTDKNTFFVFGMPEELISTLISMYSRLKNDRGLRGLFLESFLKDIPEVAEMGYAPETLKNAVCSSKIKKFMSTWLDKYGHNSIARTGCVHLCFEKVSTLAAKCIEETRPGAGYLELSTRYVNMSKAGVYPVGRLVGDPRVDEYVMACFDDYKAALVTEEANIRRLCKKMGVEPTEVQMTGKLGDHVGNMLPAAVYTSVGCTLQGEAFQSVMRHLLAEGDPECEALAREVEQEAEKIGASVLLGSHYKPTEYEKRTLLSYFPSPHGEHVYLADSHFPSHSRIDEVQHPAGHELRAEANSSPDHEKKRQKLNRSYELGSATFRGVMSFRTWRDLHRQGFCTHWRSLVSFNGFYVPPDMSLEYCVAYDARYKAGNALYQQVANDENKVALQKMCQLGNRVAYMVHGNLRQMEFVVWQRSKYGAHHEVRAHALEMHRLLCRQFCWWNSVARANVADFFFARGAELPPINEAVLTPKDRYPWTGNF